MARHSRRSSRSGRLRISRGAALWVAGAVAATILSLGASGTLASWTAAIVSNNTNTVATTQAVILKEALGATTCYSSDAPTTNSSTCSTINKYGGTAVPLAPGGSQTVDVTFTDAGSSSASSFVLTPGTCTSTPSTGTPTPTNLCTASGELSVSVNCSNGTSYVSGSKWSDLTYTGAPGSMGTLTHTASLAAGANWTCEFVASLSATASVLDQGITVSQPLTWTLNK